MNPEQLQALTDLRHDLAGRKYERNIWQIITATFDWIINKKDLRSVFCSEIVAQAYIDMELLPKDPPSNNYDPQDFQKGQKVDESMLLGELGIEIRIK